MEGFQVGSSIRWVGRSGPSLDNYNRALGAGKCKGRKGQTRHDMVETDTLLVLWVKTLESAPVVSLLFNFGIEVVCSSWYCVYFCE